ncbi:MAG: outer membrane lipoprotein carrier protein LolA [Candidatus Latescibacteria bacterium]|nr:outer membrane lipoprotein carrier protein LolA [Candidatus Latescibacterota bacterium]
MKSGWNVLVKSTLILALIFGGSIVWAQTPDPRITALEEKAKTVKSYSADMSMTIEVMGNKMVTTGTFIYKNPQKTKMETEMDMGGMKMKQITVSDGKTAWTYQPAMNMVTKIDLEKVKAETQGEMPEKIGSDLSKAFNGLIDDSTSYVRSDTVDGVKVSVFQGTPEIKDAPNMPFTPAKIETWVGDNDGLLRKMIMFNDEGKEMMTQSYSNIKINVAVDDSYFEFTPPEGAQVIDMTESSINILKEMKGSGKE